MKVRISASRYGEPVTYDTVIHPELYGEDPISDADMLAIERQEIAAGASIWPEVLSTALPGQPEEFAIVGIEPIAEEAAAA
jgi:hypothetical protein